MCVPPSNFINFWAPKITVLSVSGLYSSKIEWIGNVNCCFLIYIAVLLMCLNSFNYFHIYTLHFCFILSTLDAPTSFINNFHCSRGYRAYWRHHTRTFSPSFFLSIAFKPSSACLHLFFSVCLSLSDCSYNVLRCLTGYSLTVGIWHPVMLKCICFAFSFTIVQLLDFLP